LPRVTVRKDEPIAKALRRFKKLCKKEELTKETRKRRFYIKPSEKRRKRAKRRAKLKQRKYTKPDQRRRKRMVRGQRGGKRR